MNACSWARRNPSSLLGPQGLFVAVFRTRQRQPEDPRAAPSTLRFPAISVQRRCRAFRPWSRLEGGNTLLTGFLDRSALYGVLAEIEVLGLDLVELRRLPSRAASKDVT